MKRVNGWILKECQQARKNSLFSEGPLSPDFCTLGTSHGPSRHKSWSCFFIGKGPITLLCWEERQPQATPNQAADGAKQLRKLIQYPRPKPLNPTWRAGGTQTVGKYSNNRKENGNYLVILGMGFRARGT